MKTIPAPVYRVLTPQLVPALTRIKLNKNIENEFLMKEIHVAIDKLPENYKSVIILRDIQGLDYEQISNIIGVPLGTVKSRINRARLQLQVDLMDFKKE